MRIMFGDNYWFLKMEERTMFIANVAKAITFFTVFKFYCFT